MSLFSDLFDSDITESEEVNAETKICSTCKQELPVTEFGREGKGKNGYLRYQCRTCARTHAKIVAEIKKSAPAIPKDHKCPICNRSEAELTTYGKNKKSVWVADHNHETGTFRGWLCHKCNLGLGNLGDDTERLTRAIEYLKNEIPIRH